MGNTGLTGTAAGAELTLAGGGADGTGVGEAEPDAAGTGVGGGGATLGAALLSLADVLGAGALGIGALGIGAPALGTLGGALGAVPAEGVLGAKGGGSSGPWEMSLPSSSVFGSISKTPTVHVGRP